jgi:hypothetical protein
MTTTLDQKLVKAVVTLLCQKAATHPDFLFAVSTNMQKRGYDLQAHQQGIQGTQLIIVHKKLEPEPTQ